MPLVQLLEFLPESPETLATVPYTWFDTLAGTAANSFIALETRCGSL
jgi:hypothetical protein